MRLRATGGNAPGWTGLAILYDDALWIDEEPWRPGDAEASGLVLLDADSAERRELEQLGFELPLL